MMDVKYDEKGLISVSNETGNITLSIGDVEEIVANYDKNVYYRADVLNRIEELIKEDELDESALTNDEYIKDVLNEYAYNRDEYSQGSDFTMNWDDCLDLAFDEVDYNEYM